MRAAPLAAIAIAAILAAPAQAAKLSSVSGTINYIADQGERNDVRVGVKQLLGMPVYTFTDNDATPIETVAGACELVNGVGMCTQLGVQNMNVDVRDKDDTIQISVAGEDGLPAPAIPTVLIGGRGVDVILGGLGPDKLKGNNGRDSLRGRKGADVHKGGRGSDTLQTLDGEADQVITCGDGRRDLVRLDPGVDPPARACELGNHKSGRRGKRP